MSLEALAIEGLKLAISTYFEHQRQKTKTDEQIKQDILSMIDEAKEYHPDNLPDV